MGVEKCDTVIMRTLLRDKFSDTRRYALAEEVGNETGYQRRRLDMVVVDVYQSNGYSLEGIEIKVSKSDLRRELQGSSKHNIFFDDLDYYSLAAPSDIIDKDLIPKHWGIYAAKFKDGEWTLRTVRKPCSLHDIGSHGISRPFPRSGLTESPCIGSSRLPSRLGSPAMPANSSSRSWPL